MYTKKILNVYAEEMIVLEINASRKSAFIRKHTASLVLQVGGRLLNQIAIHNIPEVIYRTSPSVFLTCP